MTRKNARKKQPASERKAVLPQTLQSMVRQQATKAVQSLRDPSPKVATNTPTPSRRINPPPHGNKPRVQERIPTVQDQVVPPPASATNVALPNAKADLEKIVRKLCAEQGKTLSGLGREIGKSKGYVNAMFSGIVMPTAENVSLIAKALKTDQLDPWFKEPKAPETRRSAAAAVKAGAPKEAAKPQEPPQAPEEAVQAPGMPTEQEKPAAGVLAQPEPRLIPPETVGLVGNEIPQSTATSAPALNVRELVESAPVSALAPVRMTLTPVIARVFLQNNKSNRPLSIGHAQWFAKQIVEGEWDPDNGETIKFSPEGKLLDGQHRLQGCVLANTDIVVDVVYGVPEDSQSTIDVGRKRSIGDQLTIQGMKYGNQIAAAVRWVYAISNGAIGYKTSTPEVLRFIEHNPGIKDSVAHVRGHNATGTIPTMLCALHFIGKHVLNEGKLADDFVKVFTTGYPSYEGDPAHRVREMYRDAREKGHTLTPSRQAANLVHAWNLFRKRTGVKSIRLPNEVRIEGFDPAQVGVSTFARIPAQKTVLEDGTTVLERAS